MQSIKKDLLAIKWLAGFEFVWQEKVFLEVGYSILRFKKRYSTIISEKNIKAVWDINHKSL